jgi:hypothetical protein
VIGYDKEVTMKGEHAAYPELKAKIDAIKQRQGQLREEQNNIRKEQARVNEELAKQSERIANLDHDLAEVRSVCHPRWNRIVRTIQQSWRRVIVIAITVMAILSIAAIYIARVFECVNDKGVASGIFASLIIWLVTLLALQKKHIALAVFLIMTLGCILASIWYVAESTQWNFRGLAFTVLAIGLALESLASHESMNNQLREIDRKLSTLGNGGSQ